MAAVRARRRTEIQNLDSLLDTMANVTGILVVLLAVTQISVGDAMKRLRVQLDARPELTRESLERARAEAAQIREGLAPLQASADAWGAQRRQQREDLAALRARSDDARSDLRELRSAPTDPAELRRRIDAGAHEAERLSAAVAASRRELAALDAQLGGVPTASAGREARLPDPRPAPAGAHPLVWFCRYGHIQRVDFDRLGTLLFAALREATGRWDPGWQLSVSDRIRIVHYFQQGDVGDHAFRWRMLDLGPGLFYAQLDWRSPAAGESADQLASPRAEFRRELARIDPARAYIRYLVWDDSFDVYLAARDVSNRAGFAAGWTPMDASASYRDNLAAPPGAPSHPQVD
jgi:hypothetical protein